MAVLGTARGIFQGKNLFFKKTEGSVICVRVARCFRSEWARFAGQRPNFGLLLDIDGVIARGGQVLPSAKEAFRHLVGEDGEFHVPTIFVTNAGNSFRSTKAKQLSTWLGVQIHDYQVVMSHSPLKMFRQFHDRHVLVSGQGPIHEIARKLGFNKITTVDTLRESFPNLDMVDHKRRRSSRSGFEEFFPRIEGIVLFGEPARWETSLQLILDVLLTDGLPYRKVTTFPDVQLPVLACNMDLVWMAQASMPRFGHGCFLHCLESLYSKFTGQELKYTALIGKPSELTYHHAEYVLNQQAKLLGLHEPVQRLYCIGDNPDTDVYGANLYNQYLQARNKSSHATARNKHKLKQGSGAASSFSDSLDSDSDDDLALQLTESDEVLNSAESCESVLVCTGVYSKDAHSNLKNEAGDFHVNHNHRDFKVDSDLRTPVYTVHNLLEAVQLIRDKEQYS